MKDIVEKLEFYEFIISRGVNGKYMLIFFGVYEFRYFFSSVIEIENNEMVFSISIKKIIKEIIKDENKKKFLSDDYIFKLLKEKGINVVRRIVVKYCEELGILFLSKRKEY